METMYADEPDKFLELYYGVKNYELSVFNLLKDDDAYPYKDKSTEIQGRIDFITHYYAYKMLGVSQEDQEKWAISSPSIDLNQIQQVLVSGKLEVSILNLNEDDAKKYFVSTEYMQRLESHVEVSDSVGQNIIYRIATEIHGYTGDNDLDALIDFFRKDK
jgi:hypothetical protein